MIFRESHASERPSVPAASRRFPQRSSYNDSCSISDLEQQLAADDVPFTAELLAAHTRELETRNEVRRYEDRPSGGDRQHIGM